MGILRQSWIIYKKGDSMDEKWNIRPNNFDDPETFKWFPARKKLNKPIQVLVKIADVPDSNGNIYPKHVLEKSIKEYQQSIEDKTSIGTCFDKTGSWIDLSKASHLVTKLWIDNDKVFARIQTLETEYGKLLSEIIDAGIINFNIRALGILAGTIVESFDIISIDYCHQASERTDIKLILDGGQYDLIKSPLFRRVLGWI